jgi:hypothetical protein
VCAFLPNALQLAAMFLLLPCAGANWLPSTMRKFVLLCLATLALGACRERAPGSFVEADGGTQLLIEGSVATASINPLEVDTKVPPVAVNGSIALRLRGGGERMLHPVGGAYLFVPKPVLDRNQGTFLLQAPELYNREPTHRAAILREVLLRGGEPAMVNQLSSTLDAPDSDRDWNAAYDALSPPQRALVDTRVQVSLRKGGPPEGLLRAARGAIPEQVARDLGARLRELPDARKRMPRAVGALLLRYHQVQPEDAGRLACTLLAETKDMVAPEGDPEGVRALEAAALMLLTAQPAERCIEPIERLVLQERCDISLRCKADGAPIDPRESSLQDEPLCGPSLLGENQKALSQAPAQVFAWKELHVPRLALGALVARATVPPALVRAHERRRYALAPSTAPACDLGLPAGAACTCDEPTLRDQTCRSDTSPISVGFCRFEVDDAKKRIHGVSRAP